MLIQSIYCLLETPAPRPPGCCHLIGIVTVSPKGHPSFYQLLQTGGGHGKSSGFHGHGPTVTLLSACEGSSLVRSNTVWNTVSVEKTFCKSMTGVLAEAIHSGKANHVSHLLSQLLQLHKMKTQVSSWLDDKGAGRCSCDQLCAVPSVSR